MNAIELLLKDHEEIREYFKEFEAAGKSAKKQQQIAEKAITELHNHARQEETYFYPAVLAKGDQKMKDLILEGIEEHRVADFLMGRIQDTVPDDENYDPRFKVLTESVEHHMKEEERQIFPEAKKLLADEMDTLSTEMTALEHQMEG